MNHGAAQAGTVELDPSDVERRGFARDAHAAFRGPAYEGDVTYLEAEIAERQEESTWGAPLARLDGKIKNQDGKLLDIGKGDVELPRRTLNAW